MVSKERRREYDQKRHLTSKRTTWRTKWKEENKDKVRAWKRASYRRNDNPLLRRAKHQLRREARAGRPQSITCELCGRKCKTLYDHNHGTGQFRGWLCVKCNTMVGFIENNRDLVKRMIQYIEHHKGVVTNG